MFEVREGYDSNLLNWDSLAAISVLSNNVNESHGHWRILSKFVEVSNHHEIYINPFQEVDKNNHMPLCFKFV